VHLAARRGRGVPRRRLRPPGPRGGWLARGHGRVEAAAWAVGTAGVQGALVFGVAFTMLGHGPP
jgi:hypothetical protein